VYLYKDVNFKSNTLETDRAQHDRPNCVIAQQYSSFTFSLRLHPPLPSPTPKNISTRLKKVLFLFLISKNSYETT
jgi:hypothetical protein